MWPAAAAQQPTATAACLKLRAIMPEGHRKVIQRTLQLHLITTERCSSDFARPKCLGYMHTTRGLLVQGKLSGAEMLSVAASGSDEQAAALMNSLAPEVCHHGTFRHSNTRFRQHCTSVPALKL